MTDIAEPVQLASTHPTLPESQLANHCRQMLLRLPLLPIALGLAAGITFDRYIPAPWPVHLGGFVLAGLILLLAFRRSAYTAPLAVAALFLAAASLGAQRHQVTFWRVGPTHILTYLDQAGELARLRGSVLTEPLVHRPEPSLYGVPTANQPHTSFTLASEQILTDDGWQECDGLLRVNVRGQADHIHPGDAVELYAALLAIDGPRNPGEYDWRLYNRRAGLYVTASVAQPQSIRLQPAPDHGNWVDELIGRFRRTCRSVLLDGIAPDEPEAGLLATYVAGQRSAISQQINDAFRRSGTAHLLAVSGSHVALIATVGGFVGWLLLRRPKRAALVAFAAVVFFSLLVEANAPALRSAIMAILAVSGLLLGRPFSSGNWLAGSAVLLLLISPADLFGPPFQMTFAAVTALILLTRAVCNFLFGPRNLAGWVRLQIRLTQAPTRWRKGLLTVENACSYSVAAWLANAPLTVWHFGQLNPYGAIATLLITPLASVALILGFLKMLLGLLSPSLGHLLAWPVAHLADWMARMAGWLGSWPGAALQVPPPPLWLVFAIYAVLLFWALSARKRWYEARPVADRHRRPRHTQASQPRIYRPILPRYILATAAAMLGTYVLAAWPSDGPAHLRMHVLSVGNGLCVLVRSPTGRNLLYDCGSLTTNGVGQRIVVPALLALGVSRIDTVVLSHANLDHYNGLIDVATAMPVGDVWLSDAFRHEARRGLPHRLLEDLALRGVRIRGTSAGSSIPFSSPATPPGPCPITIDVLWPPADLNVSAQDANDTSVVIRISCADKKILLTGDIGRYAQDRLIRADPQALRADVLLLPHHGSARTLDPQFLGCTAPQVAVASTVDNTRTGPIARANPSTLTVLDTQTCGMVTVELLPVGPQVTTFRPSSPRFTRQSLPD